MGNLDCGYVKELLADEMTDTLDYLCTILRIWSGNCKGEGKPVESVSRQRWIKVMEASPHGPRGLRMAVVVLPAVEKTWWDRTG